MVALFTHIIIALSSVAYSTYMFFRPSLAKLRITYGLVAATVASGTYLEVSTAHRHIISACISGLVYVGVMIVAIAFTRNKLARVNVKNKD